MVPWMDRLDQYLLDLWAMLICVTPTRRKPSSSNVSQGSSSRRRMDIDKLIRVREKNWDRFLRCVDCPNAVFVSLDINIRRGDPRDDMEMPFIHISTMRSDMLYRCHSSKRLKAAVGLNYAERVAIRDMSIENSQWGSGLDYPTPDQRGVLLVLALQELNQKYPGRKFILAGWDLRPTLRNIKRICPGAASFFGDAIDMLWSTWSILPAGEKGDAPLYELYVENKPNINTIKEETLHLLEALFDDIAEDQDPGRNRIVPDLVVKPEPDGPPYAAKIYGRKKQRLPGQINSTAMLGDYIEACGHHPVRVGAWGSARLSSLWCGKSTPDIEMRGRLYGWASFEDFASLEAFVTDFNGRNVGTETLKVVSLYTGPLVGGEIGNRGPELASPPRIPACVEGRQETEKLTEEMAQK